MFCSSCGAAITRGVTYCKHCGANNLSQTPEESLSPAKQTEYLITLVWAIVAVAIVGVGAPIGLMAVMKEVLHLEDGQILGFAVMSSLPFVAAELVFIWLILRQRLGGREIGRTKGATTRGLEVAQPLSLAEPASSITEHTTHTLDRARKTIEAE